MRAAPLDDLADARLLAVLGRGGDGQVMKRDRRIGRDRQRVDRMVGDDTHAIDRQFADTRAIEKVLQAMVEFRDHHQDLAALQRRPQPPVRSDPFRECGNVRAQGGWIASQPKPDAHEEATGMRVVELGSLHDIAAMLGVCGRHHGDDARTVRAAEGEDVLRDRHVGTPEGHSANARMAGESQCSPCLSLH